MTSLKQILKWVLMFITVGSLGLFQSVENKNNTIATAKVTQAMAPSQQQPMVNRIRSQSVANPVKAPTAAPNITAPNTTAPNTPASSVQSNGRSQSIVPIASPSKPTIGQQIKKIASNQTVQSSTVGLGAGTMIARAMTSSNNEERESSVDGSSNKTPPIVKKELDVPLKKSSTTTPSSSLAQFPTTKRSPSPYSSDTSMSTNNSTAITNYNNSNKNSYGNGSSSTSGQSLTAAKPQANMMASSTTGPKPMDTTGSSMTGQNPSSMAMASMEMANPSLKTGQNNSISFSLQNVKKYSDAKKNLQGPSPIQSLKEKGDPMGGGVTQPSTKTLTNLIGSQMKQQVKDNMIKQQDPLKPLELKKDGAKPQLPKDAKTSNLNVPINQLSAPMVDESEKFKSKPVISTDGKGKTAPSPASMTTTMKRPTVDENSVNIQLNNENRGLLKKEKDTSDLTMRQERNSYTNRFNQQDKTLINQQQTIEEIHQSQNKFNHPDSLIMDKSDSDVSNLNKKSMTNMDRKSRANDEHSSSSSSSSSSRSSEDSPSKSPSSIKSPINSSTVKKVNGTLNVDNKQDKSKTYNWEQSESKTIINTVDKKINSISLPKNKVNETSVLESSEESEKPSYLQ